jgi:hypothetical protein
MSPQCVASACVCAACISYSAQHLQPRTKLLMWRQIQWLKTTQLRPKLATAQVPTWQTCTNHLALGGTVYPSQHSLLITWHVYQHAFGESSAHYLVRTGSSKSTFGLPNTTTMLPSTTTTTDLCLQQLVCLETQCHTLNICTSKMICQRRVSSSKPGRVLGILLGSM